MRRQEEIREAREGWRGEGNRGQPAREAREGRVPAAAASVALASHRDILVTLRRAVSMQSGQAPG